MKRSACPLVSPATHRRFEIFWLLLWFLIVATGAAMIYGMHMLRSLDIRAQTCAIIDDEKRVQSLAQKTQAVAVLRETVAQEKKRRASTLINPAQLLKKIAALLPTTVRIMSWEYREKNKTITLVCQAYEREALYAFVHVLRAENSAVRLCSCVQEAERGLIAATVKYCVKG